MSVRAAPIPQRTPSHFIGPYEILGVGGVGGSARVYRARHTLLDRQVAIKMLHQRYAYVPELRERLVTEARIMCSLRHPHIAEVYDLNMDERGQCYCALEWLDGRSVAEILQEGPLDVARALVIAEQVALALESAHAQGILHRDLKVENVVLVGAGTEQVAKLIDFGIASTGKDGEAELMVGTPHCMAPEQFSNDPLDVRTDVYGFGTLLYEMVAGRPAFEAGSARDIMLDVVTGTPRPLPDHVPVLLADLVMHCLAKDADARPASMTEVRRELRAVACELLTGELVSGELVSDVVSSGPGDVGGPPVSIEPVVELVPTHTEMIVRKATAAVSTAWTLIVVLLIACAVLTAGNAAMQLSFGP